MDRLTAKSTLRSIFINTAMNRGARWTWQPLNRFNGFSAGRRQTVKTVADFKSAWFHRDSSRC